MTKLVSQVLRQVALLEIREGKRFTQMELAERIGISAPTLRRWLNDFDSLDRIERDVLEKMCQTFRCQPGDLLSVVHVENEQAP